MLRPRPTHDEEGLGLRTQSVSRRTPVEQQGPGDPRRAEIVEQMSELSLLAQQLEKPEVIH
jgi:hypothetical protein